MAGLYVHIPFCRRKCLYCDFYSLTLPSPPWDKYINAIINELRQRANEFNSDFDTLYIGGGTPSLIPDMALSNLLNGIHNILHDRAKFKELTLEVNPVTVSFQKAELWQSLGFNRISIGIQSMVNSELKRIGRLHDATKAIEAYNTLREAGFSNISVDLMFGLPTQTLESLEYSIDHIISLHPAHVSVYCLTFEGKTPFVKMLTNGEIKECDENTLCIMQSMISSKLKEAGFVHYEISNYCRPGRESIHNSSYWDSSSYLGLGPASHSYDGKHTRRMNPDDLNKYINHFTKCPDSQYFELETISDEQQREEFFLTRLRTRKGIDIAEYEKLFGKRLHDTLLKKSEKWISNNKLVIENGRLHLTEESVMVSDSIILDLL